MHHILRDKPYTRMEVRLSMDENFLKQFKKLMTLDSKTMDQFDEDMQRQQKESGTSTKYTNSFN